MGQNNFLRRDGRDGRIMLYDDDGNLMSLNEALEIAAATLYIEAKEHRKNIGDDITVRGDIMGLCTIVNALSNAVNALY